MTSSHGTVTGLDYRGKATVASGGQTLSVVTFAADAMTLVGLETVGPCNDGLAWRSAVPPGAAAVLGGGVTLEAVELDATIDGQRVAFTAADPPHGGFARETTLSDLRVFAVHLAAASMALPGYRQSFESC